MASANRLEAACEHGQPREELLFHRTEQLMAPLDRRAKGPLSLGGVVCSRGEQVETATEPIENLFRGQHLDARGSQLECEREAVEPHRDLPYVLVRLEARLELPSTLREERHRVVRRKGRNRVLLLG